MKFQAFFIVWLPRADKTYFFTANNIVKFLLLFLVTHVGKNFRPTYFLGTHLNCTPEFTIGTRVNIFAVLVRWNMLRTVSGRFRFRLGCLSPFSENPFQGYMLLIQNIINQACSEPYWKLIVMSTSVLWLMITIQIYFPGFCQLLFICFGKETRLGTSRMGHAGSHGKRQKKNKRLSYAIFSSP